MVTQRNKSGKQLSSSTWLENHQNAKISLRKNFAKEIVEFHPKSIVDIGCGTGLWLSIFDKIMPQDCKFIGIDSDQSSLDEAKTRSKTWDRKCEWHIIDINNDPQNIPVADMALIFNFSSYIENLEKFFSYISREKGFKNIALKQFAGDEIKFGPLGSDEQMSIALSLKNSIGKSN